MFDESQSKLLWEHPTSLVYEKKLDTALRDTSTRIWKQALLDLNYSEMPFDLKLLLKNNDKDDLIEAQTDNTCYAYILQKILLDTKNSTIYQGSKYNHVIKIFNTAKENLKFQHNYSNKNNYTHMKENASEQLNEKLKSLLPDILIQNLLYGIDQCRKIIDKMGFTKRHLPNGMSEYDKLKELGKESHMLLKPLEMEITWSLNHITIKLHNGQYYFLPSCYMLLIHNKLADLLSTYLLCKYQEGINLQDNSTLIFNKFLKEMCKLSIKYNNNFAEISGSLEGLVIGEILVEIETWDNSDLLNNIAEELMTGIKFNYHASELKNILLEAQIPLRNEIGCCSKLFGHPFVDMEGGARKLHERTTKPKELTYEAMIWVVNKAKETFVRNYIARHGKWPQVEITSPYPGKDPLMRAMLANKYPDNADIVRLYGEVQMLDWSRVELLQIAEFQELDNIIPFLKDKSISVLKHVAVRKYIKHADNVNIKWEETRLLLYYLLNPLKKLDHIDFMKKYASDEGIELLADYLIIRIVPKEKEHKIKFRGFGIKTYLDRLRTIAQEKNMAHFLSLYCDEQAMTMGELDISRRLYSIRTLIKAYMNHIILYINCDSQAWNNSFRDETVFPVINETTAKIYGAPVMAKIHAAYEKALILIQDGDLTYSWEGQQGGIDGLNQYSWMWVYVNQIKYAMRDLPVKYHMFCKGDDMRLAVIIKPELIFREDIKFWHKLIMNNVSDAAKEFGHTIKIRESYGSEKFFSFSKCASIGTIELPQSFRKIQKVYGANNAMINTLDEYIAASFSNAHSACKYTTNTYGNYFVALVWGYYYISLSDHYKDLSDDEFTSLLLIPNMLGGFPIIYLHNMRVRAESDLLSPFLDMLMYANDSKLPIFQCMNKFLKCVIPSKRSMTKLYRDPFSLWISSPPQPTAVLRSFILPLLKRRIKNQDIIDLIKASESKANKVVIENMSKAMPQDAKVLSTIYSATPEGVLGELLRKFESGRSILDLIILRIGKKSANFKLRQVLNTEKKLQRWRYNKIKDNEYNVGTMIIDISNYNCPAEAAQFIRDKTWNTKIVGISMPPLAHQMWMVTPAQGSNDEHACNNHFLYNYEPPSTHLYPGCSHHWAVGNKEPFLGYTTRTGNIAPAISFQDNDPLLVKVKNLLDLLSWVNKSITLNDGTVVTSNVNQIIVDLLSLYTNITAEQLSPFSAVRKSGTIQHHARAPRYREAIVPNTLTNIYQNVSGSSDSHVVLRTSDMHYKVNFLYIMCECIHLSQVELETSKYLTTSRNFWGVTTNCEYCTKPIEEIPMIIPKYTKLPHNKGILNSCRISNISKELILSSYNDFNENQYKNPLAHDSPSADLAMLGVATEYVQHSKRNHDSLQQRFTQHAMSQQAKHTLTHMTHGTTSRDIGYTEIKKFSPKALTLALIPIVAEFVTSKLSNFEDQFIVVEMQRVHSDELPWTQLVIHIQNAGKLGSYIYYLSRLTGIRHPTCYENALSSSSYIGIAVFNIVKNKLLPIQICLRTWMNKDATKLELNNYINPIRWHLLDTYFTSLTRLWVPGTQDDDLKYRIAEQGVYVCALNLDVDSITNLLFDHLEPNRLHSIDITQYLELDNDIIIIMYEDEESPNYKMLEWLTGRYTAWPFEQIKQDILAGAFNDQLFDKITRNIDELKLEIGLSDIAACILSLRSNVVTEDELNDYRFDAEAENVDEDYELEHPAIIVQGKINYKLEDNIFCSRSPISNDENIPTLESTEYDFTSNKIIIDNAHCFRLFGTGTTSQSKLDHIFSFASLSRILPIGIKIMCLADGYGGFVEYLSCITQHSVFIFNTLATRPGRNVFPYAALWTLQSNENKVDTRLLDAGLDDLTEMHVMNKFIEEYTNVSVITCDADILWSDKSYAGTLLKNVINIYLHVGTVDSILICKCNLGFANHVIRCISVLKRYCRKVILVRSPASNNGAEVYIVAHGIDRFPLENYQFIATDLEYIEMDRFSLRIYNNFLRINRNQPDIYLFPNIPRSMRFLLYTLKDAISSKLISRLSLDISFTELCELSEYKIDIINKLLFEVSKIIKFLELSMHQDDKYAQKRVHYVQNTKAHKVFIKMKLMTAYGFKFILSKWKNVDYLSKHAIRIEYATQYARWQLINPTDDLSYMHYKKNFHLTHHEMFCNPYHRFMDGLRVGQMICGYLQCINKPKQEEATYNINNLYN